MGITDNHKHNEKFLLKVSIRSHLHVLHFHLPPQNTFLTSFFQKTPSSKLPLNPGMRCFFVHLFCVWIREQLVKELSTISLKSGPDIEANFGPGIRICVARHQRDADGNLAWWPGVKATRDKGVGRSFRIFLGGRSFLRITV